MIKLKKQTKRNQEEAKKIEEAKARGEDVETTKKTKKSAAELRLQKEITELDIPSHASVKFPEDGKIMNFELSIDLRQEICIW